MQLALDSWALAWATWTTRGAVVAMAAVALFFCAALYGLIRRCGQLAAFRRAIPGKGKSLSPETLKALTQILPDKALKEGWTDFLTHIVDRGGELGNIYRLDQFLSDERAPHGIRFYGFLNVAPGLFTSIGLLGTFTGIALGLAELDTTEAARIMQSVEGVIEGLSSAFWTSILGVTFAATASIFVGHWEHKLHERLAELHGTVDRLLPPVSVEALLIEQRKWREESTTREEKRLTEQSGAMSELLELTSESVGQLKFIADDLADKVSGGISDVLTPLLQDLGKSLDSHLASTADHSVEKVKDLAEQLGQSLTTGLQDSFQLMGEDFKKTSETMSGISASLKEVVGNAEGAVVRQKDAADAAAAAVEAATHRGVQSDQQLVQVMVALESVASQAAALQTQQSSAHELQGRQSSQFERIEHSVGGFQESLNTGKVAYAESAQALAASAGTFKEIIGETALQLRTLQEEMGSTGTSLRTSVEALNSRLGFEKESLSRLEKSEQAFTIAMTQARPLVESLSATVDQVAALNAAAARNQFSTSEIAGRLAEAQIAISELLSQLKLASESLSSAAATTHSWSAEANLALQDFGKGVRTVVGDSLKEYDTSLSVAVNSLANAMGKLEHHAETISESAAHLLHEPRS